MTKQRTKQWGATTTVTTLDWRTTGRTQRALNLSEGAEVTGLRRREGRTPEGPTAGCEQTARPVVWEGAGAQSPASDPIPAPGDDRFQLRNSGLARTPVRGYES